MPMLENLPTVEEMMIALSSPMNPEPRSDAAAEIEVQAELSVEDMIKEIFNMMSEAKYSAAQSVSSSMGEM